MAIRPVDLQLAYLAAPQNAAVLNAAQESPQAAQQAAAAAFAAEVTEREESVGEPDRVKGQKIRPRDEREQNAQERRRKRNLPDPSAQSGAGAGDEPLAGDGHFIDVTA